MQTSISHTIAPHANNKVLVTGANGFIAFYIVQDLLDSGYLVRGTVRTEEKADHLRQYFKSYTDKNPEALEVYTGCDISEEGAFDEAVQGVDAILHLAAPLDSRGQTDPEAFYKPAMESVLSILKSAHKHGDTLKRLVITGSAGAIRGLPKGEARIYDENDWADDFIELVKQKGESAEVLEKYRAAKVKSERAAWEYYNSIKDTVSWDMTVLNPVVVIGPQIQGQKNDSNLRFTRMFTHSGSVLPPHFSVAFVDVRDTSVAHVLTLQKEEAGGQRIILSNEEVSHQKGVDYIHSAEPHSEWIGKIPPKSTDDAAEELKPDFYLDNTKAKRILGIQYRPLPQTMKDTLDYFFDQGYFDGNRLM